METWTQKWIRPNMVLNISHFGLELGHLCREKRRGEEEKERREEEKKKKKERKKGSREEVFKVWILVKELYGICVWICMKFMWG